MTTEFEERRKFLFLGDSDGGSATGQLSLADVYYIKKRLESRVPNWWTIVETLQNPRLVGALVKLNDEAIRRLVSADYRQVGETLLAGLAACPQIVFVHESFFYSMRPNGPIELGPIAIDLDDEPSLDDDSTPEDWFDELPPPLEPEVIQVTQALLDKHGINVMPYVRNVEINLLGGEFVDQQLRNVIFRFYIPHGKIWARETETLLGLFREYLASAVNMEVRQTSHASGAGTTYEFAGTEQVTQEDVTSQFETFTEVMDLCVSDPSQAERRLIELGANRSLAQEVVERYSKQLRRLAIDIRQEREKATMRIRHRLEDELSEMLPDEELGILQQIVGMMIPEGHSVPATLGFGVAAPRSVPNMLTVNINPQIIARVEGIVAQEISGTVNLSPGAADLLRLIDREGGAQSSELKAAVYELEDRAVSQDQKLSAQAKLKAFAFAAMRKGGEKLLDAGGDVLLAYLKAKLGI